VGTDPEPISGVTFHDGSGSPMKADPYGVDSPMRMDLFELQTSSPRIGKPLPVRRSRLPPHRFWQPGK